MPADPNDPWGPIGSAVLRWLTDAFHTVHQMARQALSASQPPDAPPLGSRQLDPATIALLMALGALVLFLGTTIVSRRCAHNQRVLGTKT